MNDPNDASFTFAFAKYISLLIVAILLATGLSFGQASVSLSPSGGPPTAKLQVAGSGFSPHAAIDVYFDVKHEALAIADGAGSFSKIAIHAAASAPPGKHWVSAVQRSGDTGAQSGFWVHTNWSQTGFDGAHSTWNRYENVLSRSAVNKLSLRWSNPASGPPSVVGRAVYFGSGSVVHALNASNGHSLWQYTAGGPVDSGAPAVGNGRLFVGSDDFNVYAIDSSDGSLLWKFKTGSYIICAPSLSGETVVVGSEDNNVYALRASDGTLLWSYSTAGPVTFTPAVAGGIVYIGSSDGNVYAVSEANGSLIWKFTTTPEYNSSAPTVVNGVAYVASADDNLYALNASNGNLLWKFDLGSPADGSLAAVANDTVYVGSGSAGVFYAVDANTGTMRWKFISSSAPVYSASAVADGVVYFGSGDQNFYALDAGTGALLWRYATAGYFPTAAVTNGRVYLSGDRLDVFAVPGTGTESAKPPELNMLHR